MIADHGDVFWCYSPIPPTMTNLSATWFLTSKLRHIPGPGLLCLWCGWQFLFGICIHWKDLFPAKFGSAPQTSPWFHPLPSSIWNCLTSHCLDFLILPLGFLLVSCMLILKYLIIPLLWVFCCIFKLWNLQWEAVETYVNMCTKVGRIPGAGWVLACGFACCVVTAQTHPQAT